MLYYISEKIRIYFRVFQSLGRIPEIYCSEIILFVVLKCTFVSFCFSQAFILAERIHGGLLHVYYPYPKNTCI